MKIPITALALGLASAVSVASAQARQPRAAQGGAPQVTIPRAPMRSETGRAVLSEPERPVTPVPYVRDNRWYGHAAPDDARFRLARPFQLGRFGQVGPSHVFRVGRTDLAARRVWLPTGGFEIAAWEWDVTAPWCWTCDDFVVYDDPDHSGWYLLYDTRMGEYVHAQFIGA